MLFRFIANKISEYCSFVPTNEQCELIELLAKFVHSRTNNEAFLLKGYAGTGKTSIVSALVKTLCFFEQKVVLLAPTGRAAKVFSAYSNLPAYSIHKKIYRQKSSTDAVFQLDRNTHHNTLFIVDEASMISTSIGEGQLFGSGNLLEDLLQYVYSNQLNNLILLGDTAQLQPFVQTDCPAMDVSRLESYGLDILEYELKQVVRQSVESGILYNATSLRQRIGEEETFLFPKLKVDFPDVKRISGADLIESLSTSYDKVGVENTLVVTRSNKRANQYNMGIRSQVLQREEELNSGDWLMVTKNNYFWNKTYKNLPFIANGDVFRIVRIGRYQDLYGFRFVNVTAEFDEGVEIDVKILIDSFYTETSKDVEELNKKLRDSVLEDYADLKNKKERYKNLLENEYFNALQVKFAYAVTCHKAQGGQWDNVFVDQGFVNEQMINTDYYRWLYTAITRAKQKLFLVNFSEKYFEEKMA